MATVDPALQDPLLALRRAIAASSLPTPTTSADLSTENATEDLAQATHLYFTQPIPQSIPLSAPTRFVSANSNKAVDLRSIFFAWLKKDVAIPEYIASAQELNDALKKSERKEGEEEEQVQNLVFVERLDLITWLEGASDESEYIKSLEGAVAAAVQGAEVSASVASGAAGGVPTVPSGSDGGAVPVTGPSTGRVTKTIDPRLQEIYNGERKMGDRNTVLRGIKPTVRVALERLRVKDRTKITNAWIGLFACSKDRRNISRPQPLEKPVSSWRQTWHQATCPCTICWSSPYKETWSAWTCIFPPSRSYYPSLAFCLLPHPHVQYQIIPSGRCFHTS
jgi:parafibromin